MCIYPVSPLFLILIYLYGLVLKMYGILFEFFQQVLATLNISYKYFVQVHHVYTRGMYSKQKTICATAWEHRSVDKYPENINFLENMVSW